MNLGPAVFKINTFHEINLSSVLGSKLRPLINLVESFLDKPLNFQTKRRDFSYVLFFIH